MRLPRMTTRRWLILVAVVGPHLGELLRERRAFYLSKADHYAIREQIARAKKQAFRTRSSNFSGDRIFDQRIFDQDEEYAERYSRLVDHYSAMRREYEDAASQIWALVLWALVLPDPLEPEEPPPPPIPRPAPPAHAG